MHNRLAENLANWFDAAVHAEKRAPTRVENFVTVTAVAIPAVWLALIVQAYTSRAAETQELSRGISNCRQIVNAIRVHSSDHGGEGIYVDPAAADPEDEASSPLHAGSDTGSITGMSANTANRRFRILFQTSVVSDESIFGCPQSPYAPDGNIGPAPHFPEALKPGENHWMMTHHLPPSTPSAVPLVYENAAVATWNPKWNADAKRKPLPGRTWTKGIIVGMNDNSVNVQSLAAKKGTAVPLKDFADQDKNLFTRHSEGFPMLDIER